MLEWKGRGHTRDLKLRVGDGLEENTEVLGRGRSEKQNRPWNPGPAG